MSLRRDEAETRAAQVTVDSYALELDLTLDPDAGFLSRTAVRFRAEAGASTFAEVAPHYEDVAPGLAQYVHDAICANVDAQQGLIS